MTITSRMSPATRVRPAMSTVGSTSSTPTLMKKYDEPQSPASRSSIGT
jgi:hypothetical protein